MVDEVERWSPFRAWAYSLINRNPKSNSAAVAFARLSAADRLLDIGCGPGAALESAMASGATVSGIDPSEAMVRRASHRVPSANVKVGSAEDIPFPDDSFSVVLNISSFHHWADREAGLIEVLRVLAPGGRLHVVEGVLREGKDGHGLNPVDAELLRNKLLELGYQKTQVERLKTGWRSEHFVVSGSVPPPV